MSNNVDDLILDLLEWLAPAPRPYVEVLEAWRTSCPGLPVWEDANDLGFIVRAVSSRNVPLVSLSPKGVEHLVGHRPRASFDESAIEW